MAKSEISSNEKEIESLEEGLNRENVTEILEEIKIEIEAFSYILGLMKGKGFITFTDLAGMP